MHRFRLFAPICFFFFVMLVFSSLSIAQDVNADSVGGRHPLPLNQMERYKNIPFTFENFEKIKNEMTEEEVLSLLGKPDSLKEEHRRRDRWAFYYYPGGYVVDFRNSLVVGKEKQYDQKPLPLDQMERYKDIPFTFENFEKVENGMTEEEVLSLLGKPDSLKEEHRRRDRWAFHYYYPGGYVVNFRNLLVVGKEKK